MKRKKKILFLKAVAYGDLNEEIKTYLDQYKDETTELEVRNIQIGPKHLEYQYYQALAGAQILRDSMPPASAASTIHSCIRQGRSAKIWW